MASDQESALYSRSSGHVCTAIPDFILQDIADSGGISRSSRDCARRTLAHSKYLRTSRAARTHARTLTGGGVARIFVRIGEPATSKPASEDLQGHSVDNLTKSDSTPVPRSAGSSTAAQRWHLSRTIYDANHNSQLPGTRVIRREGQIATLDVGANEVYDAFGKTFEFFKDVFQRNSLDDHGLELVGSIHYDDLIDEPGFSNVFWFWQHNQIAVGEGDGTMFGSLTKSLDVIAHELTHGLIEYTARLEYRLQVGALNEHISDVFGSMVKQYHLNRQEARDADWLIGKEMLAPGFRGRALRDMRNPGQAYDDPRLGGRNDRQVGHMDDYVFLPDSEDAYSDNGGVHINSGIPNRAFCLVATTLGGHSWDVAGPIWYATLLDARLRRFAARKYNWDNCFAKFAGLTCAHARAYRDQVHTVVRSSWIAVGITPTDEVLVSSL